MADPSTYTVGWICALTKELVAAKSFFDEEHAVTLDVQDPADNNSYSFGRMGKHDVVVASLPMSVYGTVSAATVAGDMLRTFPNIRVGLMVGIGGGAPSPQHDIRLGDVVVSAPSGTRGGVLNYSHGKAVQQQEFQLTGSLNQPPQLLLTAVGALGADYKMKGHELEERIQEVLSKQPRLKKEYARPVAAEDRLYEISHIHRKSPESAACKDNCGEENLVTREARGDDEDNPMIHYGLIASADILDKDATIRDKLAREQGVLCFEMEAAGLMNHFPCLIIRGTCDYSDTHKNDEWQCFAAMTAAAYAKELLQRIPPTKIREEEPLVKVLGRIGIKLENITTSVKDTNATVNTMHADNKRLKIERWLKPPRSSTNVAKAKKRRHDGTGLWFIQSPEFAEFKAGSRKHLWLHGLAGCGKTVLSSQILDDLSAMDGIITLVHYFDFNDVEKQSLDGLLRSLAFQLYQHGGQDASVKLYELFKSCGDGSKDHGESQLESCINSMLSTVDRVFILIDALDECKSRDSLLSWIGRFTVENVQFLLTARPEEDIQPQVIRLFGKDNCLSLDKIAVNGDIKAYVRFVLDKNPRFMEKGLSKELRNEICTKVGDGADGMFRWAACQMDTLEDCLTPNAVRQALNSLPHDLPMTYQRMLESIPLHCKSDSIRLLQFIVNCEQPLSPAEAVEILATRQGEYKDRIKFDPQDRLFKSSNIVRYCPGMIHIVRVTNKDLDEESPFHHWEEVHLTHFSVKEYLTERNSSFLPLECAIAITETSLAYLNDVKEPFYCMCADYPLAMRAADIWPTFARTAQSASQIVGKTVAFLLDPENLSKCHRISELKPSVWSKPSGQCHETSEAHDYIRTWDGVFQRDPGFSLACRIGLHETVEYMMKGLQLKVRDQEKELCLVLAIRGKHSRVAEILLEYDASADASHPSYGPAINNASQVGLTELVRMLIEAGANVNRESPSEKDYCKPALCAASENGHLKIVEYLLEAGAHVGIHESVRLALSNSHTTIVELLEEKAFKFRPVVIASEILENLHGISRALSGACLAGRTEIARLLSQQAKADHKAAELEFWARRSPPDSSNELKCYKFVESSLFGAVKSGNEHLVQMLLDNVFDLVALVSRLPSFVELLNHMHEIFLGDHKGIFQALLKEAGENYFQHIGAKYEEKKLCTPIEVAAQIGSIDLVSQLLGADIVTDVDQALKLAVEYGHEHVVRVLLDYMADKNITMKRSEDYPFWNFFSLTDRSDSIIYMFLDRGIDCNCIYDDESTLVHQATEHGNIDLVERLLALGHAIDPANDNHCTPLQSASSIDVQRVLLAAGANANAFGDRGLTPLHTAAQRGAIEEMELLLQYGASTSALTEYGWTVLDAALSFRSSSDSAVLRTAQFLLDRGFGANDQNGKGAIPLHYACATSRVDAAMLLIKKGADVNAKDGEGKTPFQCATRGYVSKATVDLLSTLVDHGADVNSQDHKGFTALHHVDLNSRNEDPDFNHQYHLADMAELLLDYGVDVDARDKEGKTALYWFFEREQLAAAEVLIKRGADVQALGDYGETMLRAINDNNSRFPRLVPESLNLMKEAAALFSQLASWQKSQPAGMHGH
ncbi:multiple ankyrin repeats single kh domain-containing protein [Fusarium bulbicola]|nr:multiple ankyrin repeats single kh domain-containing protein [Fusarium bulbicola]